MIRICLGRRQERRQVQETGINNLRFEIVRRAVIDYDKALKYLRKSKNPKSNNHIAAKRMKEECERFFRSQWYAMLCDIPGEDVMKSVRTKYYNRPLRWGKEDEE